MSRRVKEFVDIADHLSLDEVIEKLAEVRASLPENCEAELRLRGDDVFGHRITISYMRAQTAEEVECEKRYTEAEREAKARELERLQAELEQVQRQVVAEPVHVAIGKGALAVDQCDPGSEFVEDVSKFLREGLVLPVALLAVALRELGREGDDALEGHYVELV